MSDEVLSLLKLPLTSYADWEVFDAQLTKLIHRGLLRRIEPLKFINGGYEEWYTDSSAGEIYVYIKPGDRNSAVWKRFDPFAPPPEPEPSRDMRVVGLGGLQQGEIQQDMAMFLMSVIHTFAKEGRMEILDRQSSGHKTWCREYLTDAVYRLTCNETDQVYRWDLMGFGSVEESPEKPN